MIRKIVAEANAGDGRILFLDDGSTVIYGIDKDNLFHELQMIKARLDIAIKAAEARRAEAVREIKNERNKKDMLIPLIEELESTIVKELGDVTLEKSIYEQTT